MRKIRSRFNLKVYFAHHRHAFIQGFRQLSRTPLASIMTIAILSITFTLPSIFLILILNAQRLTQNWNYHTSITVYLKINTTKKQSDDLLKKVLTLKTVSQASYISPEAGLKTFEQQAGFSDILQGLDQNPLPGIISVKPVTTKPLKLQALKGALEKLSQVETVSLDMQWIKRLQSLLAIGQTITYGLFILLSLAALLITGNTIRLTLQHYQREIQVMQLLGASRGFICRPFLYAGACYGFTTGIIATFLLSLIIVSIQSATDDLMLEYHSQFQLSGLDFSSILQLIALTTLFGFLGARLAVRKSL